MIYSSPVGSLQIIVKDGFVSGIIFLDEREEKIHPDIHESDLSSLDQATLQKCAQQLDEYFLSKRKEFTFPMKQSGTAFQQNVWNELLKIPYGKTISYLQLARQIGNVKSIRAVGAANGRNNLPIVIPCHRVIGSDGSLTGYAGGLWRKKWLLEHENKLRNGSLLF
jgi:methylated-DNA-[protein]-cysteine S-methyltransferase